MEDRRDIEVIEFLGEGGNGRVYRARMTTLDGFCRDVAVKILFDEDPNDEVLGRFRDEARILGLVRDRAIISADPPARVGGHWAIVMEYADGRNIAEILRLGPIPPRVAVEVVQETARALDSVYTQTGPNGSPLLMLHRDIKPANVQISANGVIRLLDFGGARADFGARESKTVRGQIDGTFGYVAPERFDGEDGPACDVYSLGMTLKTMLLGRRPRRALGDGTQAMLDNDPALRLVWAFADKLTAAEPEDRPTAREVEDFSQRLVSKLPEPSLRDWAETTVPRAPSRSLQDPLVGNVFTMTASRRFDSGAMVSKSSAATLLGTGVAGLAGALVVALSIGLILAIILIAMVYGPSGDGVAQDRGEVAVKPVPRPPPVEPTLPPVPGTVSPALGGEGDAVVDRVDPDALQEDPGADIDERGSLEDLEPVEPIEPELVEPEVEPAPEVFERTPDPEPMVVEPEPMVVEPEPMVVVPQPVVIDPEPVVVEPEPMVVEPEPTVIDPEPVVVEPVPQDPEPVVVEPNPAGADSVVLEPDWAIKPPDGGADSPGGGSTGSGGQYGLFAASGGGSLDVPQLKRLVTGRMGSLDGKSVVVVLPTGDPAAMAWVSQITGYKQSTMVTRLREQAFRGTIEFREVGSAAEAAAVIANTPGAVGISTSSSGLSRRSP